MVWTIEKAAELRASILTDGRLEIIVKNKCPVKLAELVIDIGTGFDQNGVRTVRIPLIEAGQEYRNVFDFPELQRRPDPMALPPMEFVEGEFRLK